MAVAVRRQGIIMVRHRTHPWCNFAIAAWTLVTALSAARSTLGKTMEETPASQPGNLKCCANPTSQASHVLNPKVKARAKEWGGRGGPLQFRLFSLRKQRLTGM